MRERERGRERERERRGEKLYQNLHDKVYIYIRVRRTKREHIKE